VTLYQQNLTVGSLGNDVATLHAALVELGQNLPPDEIDQQTFGAATVTALSSFQAAQNLPPTGIADDRTLAALERVLGRPLEGSVVANQPVPVNQPAPADGPVQPADPAQDPNSRVVRGQVMYSRGLPIAGLAIRVVHRALRQDIVLGQATTDARGEYTVAYNVANIPTGSADIQVRAFPDEATAAGGKADDAVAQSRIIYAAGPLEKTRLRVFGGPETRWSEFQQVQAEVAVQTGDLAIDSLEEKPGQHDLSLLAGKTNQPIKRVADFVLAHKMAAQTGLPAEALYGFVRDGAGTDLPTLVAVGDSLLTRVLRRASDAGVIPGELAGKLDSFAPQLRRAAIKLLVDDPAALGGALTDLPEAQDRVDFLTRLVTATGGPTRSLDPASGTQLQPATPIVDGQQPVPIDQQQKTPAQPVEPDTLSVDRGAPAAAQKFWADLAGDPRYGDKVAELQLKMQLAAMTNSHAPLVQTLAAQISQRPADTAGGLKALAAYRAADFEAAINSLPEGQRVPVGFAAPPDPSADPALTDDQRAVKAYASTLTSIIADAMPTAVLAHQVIADDSQPADLRTFFKNVAATDTDFDLRAGLTDSAQLSGLLGGVADQDRTIAEVGTIKRLFNITPDYDHLTVLKSAGLDSARAIDELGAGVFIARHAADLGGATQALMYAEKAAQISATSTALYTSYSTMFDTMPMYVLPAFDTSGRPDLETLFGSIDSCACEDCQTVLSPAAYLAELLAWLGKRLLADGRTARDVLYGRRPDLGEIELSCPNANTPLPYIDLANELLELALAPIADLVLDNQFAGELDLDTLSDQLRTAFATAGTPLTSDHEAFVVTADQHWFLTDRSTLWVIRRTGPAELTARFGSYQTFSPADELAAEAEHERPAAYELLRSARYPIGLPLDLWTAQVRTYLGHLTEGSTQSPTRAELMRTLAPASIDPETSRDIAGEALGLTVSERSLITTASPADPWVDFGLDENTNPVDVFDAGADGHTSTQSLGWLDALREVRELLDHAGLSYDELTTLLLTNFVNPGGSIRIESADPADPASCEVSALVLTGLDAAAADRLRRFTRLWRRLNRTAFGASNHEWAAASPLPAPRRPGARAACPSWPMRQLDDLISAVADGIADVNERLGEPVLIALAGACRLQQELGIGVDELPGFWAALATARPDDQYQRLFADPAVIRPLDAAFTIDPGAGPELAIVAADPATAQIDQHAPTILAALQLGATDLAALLAVLPDTTLTLANLSALYRQARLARALALTVPELLALIEIADDPFPAGVDGPAATLRFAQLVAQIRSTGMTFSELDYLLFHQNEQTIPGQPIAVTDDELAVSLDDLRGNLRTLVEQTIPAADPDGALLTKALAGLRWPAGVITSVISALDGTAAYTAPLADLPLGLIVPPTLLSRLSQVDGTLTIRGALTSADHTALLAASADAAFDAAVEAVFAAPRDVLATALKVFEWPALPVPLAALPAGIIIPADLRARVYYDGPAAQLVGKTPITAAEAVTLAAASTDPTWSAAVSELLAAPAALVPDPDQAFLTAAAAAALVDTDADPATRFGTLLGPVLDYVRRTAGQRLVVQQFSQDFGIPATVADRLVGQQLPAVSNPALPAITDFLATAFVTSDADVTLSRVAFGAQFDSYLRMYKVAQVVARLRLTTRELAWLNDFAATIPDRPISWRAGHSAGWWNPATVPVTPIARTAEPLAALLRAVDLDRLRDGFTEDALDALLRAARDPGVTVAALTAQFSDAVSVTGDPVPTTDVASLISALQVTLPADFTDETGASRLRAAIRYLRRIGASAAQLLGLAAPEPTAADARTARQLVRAKYDDAGWQIAAKPLRDVLRAQQRTALLGYALSHPELFAPYGVRDEAALYGYLLIDSQMEPIMMTSRIAQATLSIQQFVQRCTLNLEPDVTVDAVADPGWNDWSWMSNYPFWAGSRQVLCFPENVLDPSLRDDKTPFFVELESALMQDDVTAELAEDAFASYLSRLNDVARLEILGLWDQGAVDGQPATLHVFGRTRGKAPKYYHRTRINGAAWTAWQQIDIDISEPQILPIVWNRRLYLFWPVFTEVTPDPTPGDKPVMPTNRYFTITLAYSRFARGKWQPKQLTDLAVKLGMAPLDDSDDHGKSRVVLRANLPGAGGPDLWIWPEWDDPSITVTTVTSPYIPGTPGSGSTYATVTGFHFTGADDQVEPFNQNISGIYEPNGTTPTGMLFVQQSGSALKLPVDLHTTAEDTAFTTSPPTFSLAYPHQDYYLSGQRTFVYQDGSKSYVVDPTVVNVTVGSWVTPSKIHPGVFGELKEKYYPGTISAAAAAIAGSQQPPSPIPAGPGPIERIAAIENTALAAKTTTGTNDPVRLALAQRDNQVAYQSDATAAQRDLTLLAARQDKRFVVSKADKTLVPISQYIDPQRVVQTGGWQSATVPVRRYLFRAGFHPYVTAFEQDLAVGGVQRLLTRANQQRSAAPFTSRYGPKDLVLQPFPVEDVDFTASSTYQQYNWELFFHAPLMIAMKLSANQRFADAQRWFHRIFDPTDTSNGPTPARFWQTLPMHDQTQNQVLAQRITDLLAGLAGGTADAGVLQQVAAWRAYPFNPYAIARLRMTAFQKMVVMAYLDNLIAWADQAFRRDTRETINTAMSLYALAGEILGRRATVLAARAQPQVRTAVSLDPDVDAFSDKLVRIEQVIGAPDPDAVVIAADAPPLSWPKMLYFGMPANDRLSGYWDTVADRLFKIRNSMNIEGLVRALPLFEPPIDPVLLVRAAAAGIDLSSALADSSAPAPHYRFHTLAAQALAMAGDVRALGAAVLAALEKKDAETLAALHATNERLLGDDLEKIRTSQQAEATQRIAVLRAQRQGVVQRYLHFQKLLGVTAPATPVEDQPVPLVSPSANATITTTDGVKLLDREKSELDSMSDAAGAQQSAAGAQGVGSILAMIPTYAFRATPWGIGVGSSWGGSNMAAAAQALASVFTANAASSSFDAVKSSRLAQAVFREHDWVLQSNQAAEEIMFIDSQRIAAEIARDVATGELSHTQLARDQSVAVQEFLTTKYTNAELYSWLVTQVSALHFQAYQLAFDLAKKAERAMRRELGTDSDLIQFGYWDSLRRGLLAGERLELAVQRMQSAYLDQNRRTYEITKHVSLAAVNPAALVDLRETGTCYVQLPEALFDLDRPGDYRRRIKMVSVTLPAVTGPYTSVNLRLTLLTNSVRVAATPATPYPSTGLNDTRFYQSTGGVTSIVTSSGRDDTGLFAPNFSDDRFLPFEGEGVISSWRLELPSDLPQFDYQTISDVVLTIRYTALDGGDPLRTAAVGALKASLGSMEVDQGRRGLYRLFSARHDYPDAWQAMRQPPPASTDPQTLSITIGPERFPFVYRRQPLKIDRVALFFRTNAYDEGDPFTVDLQPPTMASRSLTVTVTGAELGGLPAAVADLTPGLLVDSSPWTVALTALPAALVEQVDINGTQVDRLKADALDDIGILVHYTF
jgi:hypothetical protein